MENEYARLCLEEGIPGVLLWVAFVLWLLIDPRLCKRPNDGGGRMGRLCAAWGQAAVGTGLLASVRDDASSHLHGCPGNSAKVSPVASAWETAPILAPPARMRDWLVIAGGFAAPADRIERILSLSATSLMGGRRVTVVANHGS